MSRQLDLFDALIYADGFDCALNLEEVRRYSLVEVEHDELRPSCRAARRWRAATGSMRSPAAAT